MRDKQILSHLNGYLADTLLVDIEPAVVRNLYAALSNRGMGSATVLKTSVVLNLILKQAVFDDIILRNPCDRVESPKRKKPKVGRSLDKVEVARLVGALDKLDGKGYPLAKLTQQKHTENMAHTMAVRLALSAGLRRGEVLGLSWGDIDFKAGEIHVRHTLCRATGELKVPKTESGNRVITLDGNTMSLLQRWRVMQARYLMSLGVARNDELAVITNTAGNRMDGNALSRWWHSFIVLNGFEGLRFHDLRHTHATMLVSSGVNIKAVSARMGHSNVGITLDLYSHAQREDDQKAASIIGEIMSKPAPEMDRVVNL